MNFRNIYKIAIVLVLSTHNTFAQNPLAIPTALTGTTFNLNVQNGTTQFWPGINTPTFGINGNILGPTLIINKWDWVTMNVTNSLTGTGNSTTMHWHGLHVPAMDDGGPHQIILQGSTWSPTFQMLNNASTFWYHPHGNLKTDLQVSKGLAGMIIVKDSIESALTLPRTYGVDDFPVVVQTKAFDVLNQIAISTELDTLVLVNGTPYPYLNAPAQVIRLRLLNGSSMRTFNFGFTANKSFKMIATDGGLLDSAITLTRIRLSPGERAEILLDLQGMQGQTISLNSFSSELPNGIYGCGNLTGMGGATILDYNLNPLNGANFSILQLNVVAPTVSPVTTTPTALTTNTPFTAFTFSRNFTFAPVTMGPSQMLIGPFDINGAVFNMNVINVTTYLNATEKWRITNNTSIAHPFHIHDVEFDILNINGGAVPNFEKGKKDVVLVMPQQYVEFVTKFEDFADDSVPYMYHCHLLHHEDDGMMGSFIVLDTTTSGINENNFENNFTVYPNPTYDVLNIVSLNDKIFDANIFNSLGEIIYSIHITNNYRLSTANWPTGIYFLQVKLNSKLYSHKIVKG